MADKILQGTVPAIIASNVIYDTKLVSLPQSSTIVTNTATPQITTDVETPKLVTAFTGIGESSVPNSSLFKRAQEFTSLVDTFKVSANKIFAESSTIAETFRVEVTYRRIFTEPKITSELFIKTLGKGVQDTAQRSDVSFRRVGKGVVENKSAVDSKTIKVDKSVQDLAQPSDTSYYQVGKSIQDTKTATDLFSRAVNYNRLLTDFIDATDDFLGEANIDDDQVARVNKVIVDYGSTVDNIRLMTIGKNFTDIATTAELFSRTVNYNRSATDLVQRSDTSYYQFGKSIQDTKNVIDQFTTLVNYNRQVVDLTQRSDISFYQVGKNLQDLIQSPDTSFYRVSKNTVDTVTKTDTFTRTVNYNRSVADIPRGLDLSFYRIGKGIADLAQESDISYYRVGKGATDTATSTDTLTRAVNYNRSLTDFIDATDDFLGVANIDDDQVARVGKGVTDTTTTADTLTRTVNYNKSLTDTAQESDTSFYRVGKGVTDTATSTDTLTRAVNYNRSLTDFIDATDDFLGVANIDDDQVARVGKILLNYANIADPNSKSFGKQLQDNQIGTDIAYKNLRKNIVETLVVQDVITFLKFIGYQVLDTVASNDSGFINNQNYFADTYVLPGYVGTNTNFS